jgi:predicted permease
MGLSRFLRRKYWDEERAREVDAHLEIETADNVARGMPADEARYAARRKLGNVALIREEIYRMNSIGLIETIWQDLRYAVRVLRKSPGFTLIAVLSLALGIGANTAVFSVVNAVLLRSLPYPAPDQLVLIGRHGAQFSVSIPEYEFSKEHASSFVAVAGHRGAGDGNLRTRAGYEWIKTMTVTADFFRVLGVSPALGREFNAEETRSGGPQAIILSDALWRRAFDADPDAVGRAVKLNDTSYTVVGIAPGRFWFPQAVDAFVPLRPTGSVGDMGMNTEVIARLRPGISLRQAGTEMGTLTEGLRQTLTRFVPSGYRGLTVTSYQDSLVGDVRRNLVLLFGVVALLLLIACSNLASLMLARLAARQKEIAVRLALGSSQGRLLRQFFVENALLGAAGSVAGLLGAYWLLDGLVALIPFHLPASAPIRMDLPVLAFTLAVGLGTVLGFSLTPLLTSTRLDIHDTLKSAGRLIGPTRQRSRSFLVVSEVALSVTLLVSAALLIQSLYRMQQERLGFAPQGLTTFWTRPAPGQFEARLLERLQAAPGVRSVAAINVLPLTGQNNFPAEREGHPEASFGAMEIRLVTPAYFETMGIRIAGGRSFSERDTAATPPVILVNEALVRRWWPQGKPLGDRIVIGRYQGKDLPGVKAFPREVVGIVADTKTVNLKAPPRATVYLPAAQEPSMASGMAWVVRGALSAGLAEQLRQAAAEVDPRQRLERIRTMDQVVAATTGDSRFYAWLFGIFAALALALTAIGVYGLLSFSVARRTNEFGIRMALGASRAEVLHLILQQGATLTAIGLAVGLAGALALTRYLSSLLFVVRPTDPVSFLAVSGLLLGVGLLASYVPARRATQVDPMVALRCE